MKRLTGLVAATPTPLDPDGTIAFDRIPGLVEFLIAQGVDGFYLLGSTGEGPSFTSAERQQAATLFLKAIAKRKPAIVQVGHNSPAEARMLAMHAAKAGADAISATAPSYFRPNSVAALTACLQQVAVGAPELPFYYYHIPSVTGVTVDMPDFLQQAAEKIPNLIGVKFTSPAIWEYQACVELEQGRFDCLYGHDEMLLPALAVGARGAVGSTYNYATPIYQRVIQAFKSCDLEAARRDQARANAMIRVVLRHGGLPAIKAAVGLVGFDCGPVRAPLTPLTSRKLEELHEDLIAAGFFQSLSKSPALVS